MVSNLKNTHHGKRFLTNLTQQFDNCIEKDGLLLSLLCVCVCVCVERVCVHLCVCLCM